MTERVSKLHVVDVGSPIHTTEDAMLNRIVSFVDENLIDMSGDYEADIELTQASPLDRKLGVLSAFERKAFCIAALLSHHISELLVELEADSAEQIAKIMREKRINFTQSMQEFTGKHQMTDEQRAELNMATMTHANVYTLFDWSIRQRFSNWNDILTIHEGFVVYIEHG